MTILLSGSTGFLGSYLLKLFIRDGYKVIALKRSTSNISRIDKFLNSIVIYDIDKIELSQIFKNHKINIVVNTVINYGRKDNKLTSVLDTNLMFNLNLLEVSIASNIKAFVNADTLLDRRINAYALSKAQFVDWMKFLSNKNTKMINIKIEHMYGLEDDENKFIYWLVNKLEQNVEKIDLTSGVQKRDFIYIDDIVNAYKIIIGNIDKFSNYEEFELGSGHSIEVKKFVKKIYEEIYNKQVLNTKLNFGVIPYRDNENMNIEVNLDKILNLGWKPKVFFEEGIKRIIEGKS
ncbi:NAD-dependent epimerase/dehydratase [Halarcobacter ebronensis]|uniref:Epimerase n=1 Tax=Halarcobacter ebronensis TaxID=1462615 RepID=A0A4Q1ASE6_9BACT|nr:NAD-dependent epimerase/dehydratase [Halarcobacter ebronensis]QKF81094.1 NAD-dependent epimerase/dehydratase [Halarcobacter ebronensis]RXK06398.1 epimerase [Halarcobacter ebronensis]